MRPAAAVLLGLLALAAQAQDIQGLLQLIDYVGVDYPGAVSGGRVVNDLEYEEMREFSRRIARVVSRLETTQAAAQLGEQAARLEAAVANKAEPDEIADLTRRMRRAVMASYDVALTPNRPPELPRARELYAQQCAACHGAEGSGDGPAAAGMDPPPTNFRDRERARQRSLFGLFTTITLGVEGTLMQGFDALSPGDRWSLAFHVGGLAGADHEHATGESESAPAPPALRELVTLSPAEMGGRYPDGERLAFRLRRDPSPLLFAAAGDPLDTAMRRLEESLELYRAGDRGGAERTALSAYLDGVELSEPALVNAAPGLMRDLERAMLEYRQAIARGAPAPEVESLFAGAHNLALDAKRTLAGTSLSRGAAFTSSLIILLREGMEAILVLAAMIAFLIRTGRRQALVYIHAGWIGALAAGIATWVVSAHAFTISGAAREVTEGVATLAAAAILFYVGFWMHRNANLSRWSRYLHGRLQAALGRQTLWTLCAVSFLAVYREVFETMLFYEALWLQVTAQGHAAVVTGGGVAVVLLLLVVWLVSRSGMRLPMRQFFLASAVLMVALAILFAGRGVGALQEAGRIPSRPLGIPGIEYIGVHPTVQAAAVQLLLLVLAVGLVLYERRANRAA